MREMILWHGKQPMRTAKGDVQEPKPEPVSEPETTFPAPVSEPEPAPEEEEEEAEEAEPIAMVKTKSRVEEQNDKHNHEYYLEHSKGTGVNTFMKVRSTLDGMSSFPSFSHNQIAHSPLGR